VPAERTSMGGGLDEGQIATPRADFVAGHRSTTNPARRGGPPRRLKGADARLVAAAPARLSCWRAQVGANGPISPWSGVEPQLPVQAVSTQDDCLAVGKHRPSEHAAGIHHYPLLWRDRTGFARFAIEYSYPIVPFSMIGVDNMWNVVVDSDSALYAPARALALRLDVDPDLLWPPLWGLGPTPLPRSQRIYARISDPIDAGYLASAGCRSARFAVAGEPGAGLRCLPRCAISPSSRSNAWMIAAGSGMIPGSTRMPRVTRPS
jgi:hypothetical protein